MNDTLVQEQEKTSFYKAFFNEDIYVLAEEDLSFLHYKNAALTSGVPVPKQISLSGNKMANTLLLFNYPQTTIPEADKTFLNQVLKAVSLSLETVAWINVGAHTDFNWEFLQQLPQIENIITFGLEENKLPEEKAESGKIHIYSGRKMLCVGKLADIEPNINQKKLLWEGLKNIFNL